MDPAEIAQIKESMETCVQQAFEKLDVNGDGHVTMEEMQQVLLTDTTFQFPQQIENSGGDRQTKIDRLFKMMDANADGKITLQEMKDCASRMIDEMIADLTGGNQ